MQVKATAVIKFKENDCTCVDHLKGWKNLSGRNSGSETRNSLSVSIRISCSLRIKISCHTITGHRNRTFFRTWPVTWTLCWARHRSQRQPWRPFPPSRRLSVDLLSPPSPSSFKDAFLTVSAIRNVVSPSDRPPMSPATFDDLMLAFVWFHATYLLLLMRRSVNLTVHFLDSSPHCLSVLMKWNTTSESIRSISVRFGIQLTENSIRATS